MDFKEKRTEPKLTDSLILAKALILKLAARKQEIERKMVGDISYSEWEEYRALKETEEMMLQ